MVKWSNSLYQDGMIYLDRFFLSFLINIRVRVRVRNENKLK